MVLKDEDEVKDENVNSLQNRAKRKH